MRRKGPQAYSAQITQRQANRGAVFEANSSTDGTAGAYGYCTATTGATHGVYGTSESTTRGYSGAGSAGVYGKSTNSGGVGVMGESGTASNGSAATFANRNPVGGIYGVTSHANGSAGFFHGRVVIENTTASGSTTVSREPFIIWNSGSSGFNSSGVLFTPSDRNVKENFVPTDGKDVSG